MVNEMEFLIKSRKCPPEKLGLLHLPSCSHFSLLSPELPASIPSLLQRLMLVLSTCLHESKARATNYSQIQKYWSVMVGPASGLASRRERERVTAKNGFKQCVMIDIFI